MGWVEFLGEKRLRRCTTLQLAGPAFDLNMTDGFRLALRLAKWVWKLQNPAMVLGVRVGAPPNHVYNFTVALPVLEWAGLPIGRQRFRAEILDYSWAGQKGCRGQLLDGVARKSPRVGGWMYFDWTASVPSDGVWCWPAANIEALVLYACADPTFVAAVGFEFGHLWIWQ